MLSAGVQLSETPKRKIEDRSPSGIEQIQDEKRLNLQSVAYEAVMAE
jgi:hypothetical protein